MALGSIKSALNVPSGVFKSDDKSQLDAVIKDKLSGFQQVGCLWGQGLSCLAGGLGWASL